MTSSDVVIAEVTDRPIEAGSHEAAVAGPDCGAVVSFAGVVRNHDEGREVLRLEYSGHPSAPDIIRALAVEAAGRPGVAKVAVSHRIGELAVGDAALIVAVSSAHREPAFTTCGWLVEEVKRQLPIWKKQDFADGTSEWVNCP